MPNYILLDAALWEEDMDIAKQYCDNYVSLFRGRTGEELYSVAPFLMTGDAGFVSWVDSKERKDLIGRRTLRLCSELAIDDLRKHLRRFLRIQTASGAILYYRFYDPKVVAYTFPHLTKEQLIEFFNGIEYVFHHCDVLNQKRTYSLIDQQLKINIEHEIQL